MFLERKKYLICTHGPVVLIIFFCTFLFRSIPRGFYVQNKGLMKWPNRPVVTCTASMWNQSDRKTNTVLSTFRNYFGHFTSPILFGSKIPPSFMYNHIYYVLFSWTMVPTHVHVFIIARYFEHEKSITYPRLWRLINWIYFFKENRTLHRSVYFLSANIFHFFHIIEILLYQLY